MDTLKKRLTKYTTEEVAEGLIISQKLTKAQQIEAREQLAAARKQTQALMTDTERMTASLLQLRFKLEDYIESKEFISDKNFGYFLSNYLTIINRKRNQFAAEIDIHETLLSQLINNRRSPGENIIIRLEIHSNNTIPASYWYRLVEKEKQYYIETNQKIRRQEKKFVKNRINITI